VLWWKGAVAVAVPAISTGEGKGLELSPLLLPRGPSRDNPTKIAITYYLCQQVPPRCSLTQHHYLDSLDRWLSITS